MADAPHDRRRRVEYVIGACMLFSESAQHAAGEIDERIWFGPDDADWCFKIREAGLEIGYEPAATVIHKYRRTSRARPLSMHALRHLRAFVMFQRQWAPRRAALKAAGRAMDAEARAEREAQLPKAAAA
jgi:GT2 family glycosyltransferase